MKTKMKSTVNRQRLTRAASLCLLALAATLLQAHEARAQWTQPDAAGNVSSTNTGNVGIGTSSPSSKLDVNAAHNPQQPQVQIHNGASTARVRLWADAAAEVEMWKDGTPSAAAAFGMHKPGLPVSDDLVFSTYNTSSGWMERFKIQNTTGNVGIGTQNPSARLSIAERLRFFDAAPTGAQPSTDAAVLFGASIPSGLVTELTGQLITYGINVPQLGARDVTRAGGIIRLDTRTGMGLVNGDQSFVVFGYPAGSSSETPRMVVSLQDGTTLLAPGGGRVGIGTQNPDAQYKLDVAGDVRVTGNISAKYQDVAEWVPSKQKLQAGTVVILDPAELNHVLASDKSYDTGVAGVVSAQPGIALGEGGEGKVLVATTGRVKVKVDATRAPIKVGDLLVTSDVAGVAMKSQPLELGGVPIHRPGTLIGKALEPLAGGTGEILVLLSLQ